MSIVSKRGDDGYTDLPCSGKSNTESRRVRKDDPFIECLGTIDELDAFLSLGEIALKSDGNSAFSEIIGKIKEELFAAVMPLATEYFAADGKAAELPVDGLNSEWLMQEIAKLEKKYPVRGFVRTWTRPTAAALNAARAVCRRCERRVATALLPGKTLLPWFNRLSDLLFLLAVAEEKSQGLLHK